MFSKILSFFRRRETPIKDMECQTDQLQQKLANRRVALLNATIQLSKEG